MWVFGFGKALKALKQGVCLKYDRADAGRLGEDPALDSRRFYLTVDTLLSGHVRRSMSEDWSAVGSGALLEGKSRIRFHFSLSLQVAEEESQ
jgi:hypothetical protein